MAARFLTALAAGLLLIGPTTWAQSQSADPPGRVGRLSVIEGNVQQRTADDNDWTQATLNYPVTSGLAIAPQEGGRAEIQVGSMALRVGSASELDINSLGDHDATLTLAQGELNVRLGRLASGDRIEIVTPRGVMDILAAGQYHIDAGTTESPTRFEVFNGRAELQRDAGNTVLGSGQAAVINADDAQSLTMAAAAPDPLDEWAFARDRGSSRRRVAGSAGYAPPSAGYVSPEMTGADDLDAYGSWNTDQQYGAIWYPRDAPADWAPYRYGHWGWVSPWGWTWIDDEPWGFAPFHYGRWAYTGIGWGWIPGVVIETPVYAPALVVFFGGPERHFFYDGYREGIGWCPLGPGEVFVPGYHTSVTYVRNVNITNININQVNITQVNNTIVVNNASHWEAGNFANYRFATVVPTNSFAAAQHIHEVAVRPSQSVAIARLPAAHDPAVATPRTAAVNAGSASIAAPFNRDRSGHPPIPVGRTGSTAGQPNQIGATGVAGGPANRFAAGRSLPALPPAHVGAAVNNRATTTTQGNGTPDSLQGGRRGPFGAGAQNTATATGRGLPPLPPAHGGAAVNNRATGGAGTPQSNGTPDSLRVARPGHGAFGPGTRNATSNAAGRNLPALPPAHGAPAVNNGAGAAAPQGNANNPATQAFRAPRGPFGTNAPSAPRATTSSAGQGLRDLPTNRQQWGKTTPGPPPPLAHPQSVPTGVPNTASQPQRFQRDVAPTAAPARPNINAATPHAPPPQTFQRNIAPPTHVAPPAAPSRPSTNAMVPHAPPPQTFQRTIAPTTNVAPPAAPARPSTNAIAPHAPPPQTFQRTMTPPTHVTPPAAPARPATNAAVSHEPPPHPAAGQPPAKNQKRDNNNN